MRRRAVDKAQGKIFDAPDVLASLRRQSVAETSAANGPWNLFCDDLQSIAAVNQS